MLLLLLASAACGDSTPSGPTGPTPVPAPSTPAPSGNEALLATLHARLDDDRTGTCLAAAVVGETTQTAVVCAKGSEARGLDTRTAFEIGSISKTMTGLLLAEAEAEKKIDLDAPLERYAPAGTNIPAFEGQSVRLVHVATHTAGLPSIPSGMKGYDPANPYIKVTSGSLWSSLADVSLTAAPGAQWSYSNFGYMLLSTVLAQATGTPFAELLRTRIFEPLGMHAFVGTPPNGLRLATGHASFGAEVPGWTFGTDTEGVGGVRASIDDMAIYARAALGGAPPALEAAFARATATTKLPTNQKPDMGLGFIRIALDGSDVVLHDGGTGGFSSFMLVDRTRRRAVVVLADTTWGSIGGLDEMTMHLYRPDAFPRPEPRIRTAPARPILDGLVGTYDLDGLEVRLEARAETLVAHVDGTELSFGHDSYGDFFADSVDAILSPVVRKDGRYEFDWKQGGAILHAVRRP